jgi:transposase-like protein
MGRPSSKAAAEKKGVVLAVWRGEITVTEAARRESVSATSISNWRERVDRGCCARGQQPGENAGLTWPRLAV